MNILVCIKQVPASSNVAVDPVTGVLIRDGNDAKMNPYDLFALEAALALSEKHGGSVDVLTMGPPSAASVLYEAIYMGAEKGTLLSDRRLGGADVLATAYTISQGAMAMGRYDLILCGKQTTDGDTAQVGPEMAEFLGFDHATNVTEITDISDSSVTVTVNFEDTKYVQKMSLPCLITVDKDINTPRLPSYKRKKAVTEDMVTVKSLDDFEDRDPSNYGLRGSATTVEKIFPPEKNTDRTMLEGSGSECASELYDILASRRLI